MVPKGHGTSPPLHLIMLMSLISGTEQEVLKKMMYVSDLAVMS